MNSDPKNIAIIEIYGHHVFVHTLATSLLKSGYKVTVYVTEKIYADLAPMFKAEQNKPNFCVSKSGESDFFFLKRIKQEIENNYHLVFINSIQGIRIGYFFLIKFKVPTLAAAGRISEFFRSRYKLTDFETIRQLLHHNYTKFLLPKVVNRLCGLIVHTEKARELALSEGFNRPIHCMPFSLNVAKPVETKSSIKKINFLITGSITSKTRDYFAILKVFEEIWASGLDNAKLTILSSPKTEYGFKVYREMKRLSSLGYPIRYFESWIPEDEFVRHTSKADFFIAPILKKYYGAGEITSVEVESIRMGIPAFYPDWYSVDSNKQEFSILYSSFNNLKEMIVEFCSDKARVEALKVKALKNTEVFGVNPVSKSLYKFLNQDIWKE